MPWLLAITAILMVLKLSVVPALAWWMVFAPLIIGVVVFLTFIVPFFILAWIATK